MAAAVRVLHVDDDVTDRVATPLTRKGDGTTASADGALGRIRDDTFDCVVSDYEMPGTDGIELFEAVRGGRPDLPFILFTGHGSEAVASDAIFAGVTDYLHTDYCNHLPVIADPGPGDDR